MKCKKLLSLICAAALVLLSLTACGNGGDGSGASGSGTSVSGSGTEDSDNVLVIDEDGNIISGIGAVIDEDGNIISNSGVEVDEDGKIVEGTGFVVDKKGNIISGSGTVKDKDGNVIDSNVDTTTPGENLSPYQPDTSSPVLDNVTMQKAADKNALQVVTDGEWLYYIDINDNSSIHRCKLDGSSDTQISSDSVSWLTLTSDGKIKYSTDYEAGMKSNSYTINADGSGKVDNNEMILDIFPIPEVKGSDGRIYYVQHESDTVEYAGLYVREEGQGVEEGTQILKALVDSFVIEGDWLIVSVRETEGEMVFRMKYDGSDKSRLFESYGCSLTQGSDGTLYFVNESDGRLIYKMSASSITA